MTSQNNTSIAGGINPYKLQRKQDLDVFKDVLNRIEHREHLKTQALGTIANNDVVTQQTIDKLPNDPNIRTQFLAHMDAKNKQIQDKIDAGEYEQAIQLGTTTGAEAAKNVAAINSAYKNYENERKAIKDSSKYDELTKQYWEAKNPFDLNLFDDSGNVINNQVWKSKWTPLEDINISNLQNLAAQMTAAQHGETSFNAGNKITYMDREGNPTNDRTKAVNVYSVSKRNSSSKSFNKKLAESMEKTFNNILNDSNITLQLKQKLDVQRWAYDFYSQKALDESLTEDERNKYRIEAELIKENITDSNGIIYGDDKFKDWVKGTIFPQFKNMEYNNITTSTTEGESQLSEGVMNNNLRKTTPNYNFVEETHTLGVPVEKSYIMDWNKQDTNAETYTNLIAK